MNAKEIINNKDKRESWLKWLKEQLDDTNNASYKNTETNRVFLTSEDDIDIAKYLLETFHDVLLELDNYARMRKLERILNDTE